MRKIILGFVLAFITMELLMGTIYCVVQMFKGAFLAIIPVVMAGSISTIFAWIIGDMVYNYGGEE
jgi:hypothetical protein